MELFQLRYAVMLAECCNFSRAADRLFITQPTLSLQIRKLEKDIGFPLFYRNSRQVTPTTAGERFLAYAVKVIQEYEKLEKEVGILQGSLRDSITFGTSSVGSQFFSEDISLFLSKFPQVEVKITETHDPELIDKVIKNKLDLALTALPNNFVHRDKLRVIPIQEEYICAIVKKDHPLAARPEVALEDLVNYKLIFSSHRGTLQNVMTAAFEEHDLPPREILDLTSMEARIPYIMNGAISFALSGRNEWSAHDDIIRLPVTPRIYCTLSLILPKEKQASSVLESLITFLLQSIKKHFNK